MITPNTEISPFNTLSADTYTEVSSSSQLTQTIPTISGALNYTASIYAKRGNSSWYKLSIFDPLSTNSCSAYFNIETGIVGGSKFSGSWRITNTNIYKEANGWYRLRLSSLITNSGSITYSFHSVTSDLSDTRVVNSFTYIVGAMLDPSSNLRTYLPTSEPPEVLPSEENVFTETFNSLESTSENGWTGSGNTVGDNNFQWNSSNSVLGGSTGGSAGGVFARSADYRYFANTEIGELNRQSSKIRLAGSFILSNNNFDGIIYLGYFTPGQESEGFIGIQISEPSLSASGPFRGRIQVNSTTSGTVNLNQNTRIDFDLTWLGTSNGSGILSGTIAGQVLSISAPPGTGSYTAFGLLTGGLSDSSRKTGNCFFDNLTYSISEEVEPPVNPDPPVVTNIQERVDWIISTYSGLVVGGSNPNGTDGQRFGWTDVLANLKLSPESRDPIDRFLSLMQNGQFNSALMPAGSAWIMSKHWNKFTSSERTNIVLPRLKSVSNVLSHGTENQFLNGYVGAYIWSQLWPEEDGWYNIIERRNVNSSELSSFTKTRLLTVLRSIYSKGYNDNISPNQLPFHLYPLHVLYSCATDPELKQAANAVLTMYVSEMAANFFEGSTIAPYNREAEQQVSLPQENTSLNTHVKAVYWLYWAELMNVTSVPPVTFPSSGSSLFNGEASHFALASALSDWRPPSLLADLAKGNGILPFTLKSASPNFGEFGSGAPAYTSRTVYRTSKYSVGSANFTTRIANGLSQRTGHEIIVKSGDNQNTITCHHPYWKTNTQYASGNFTDPDQYRWLSRSSPFQQNVQHESTVISLFNIPSTDPFQGRTRSDWEILRNEDKDGQGRGLLIQQAWVRYPKSMDEVVETGGWIFLREGGTFVAIRPWLSYTKVTDEFSDMDVVRSSGEKNIVIMDVSDTDQFETFASFRSAVLSAPLTVNITDVSVTYTNVKGSVISAQFGNFVTTSDVINSYPVASVDSVPVVSRDPDFVDSKSVIKSAPISLTDRVLTVSMPNGRITVDWRSNIPVFSDQVVEPEVTDPLPEVNLSVSPESVLEDGEANLVFTFSRTGPITEGLVVNYTVSGTAVTGLDYTGISSTGTTKTVNIPAGSSSVNVTVDPTSNTITEENKTVILTVAVTSRYTVGALSSATGTIVNDDVPPPPPTVDPDPIVATNSAARKTWLINQYQNVTIGSASSEGVNGTEARKFGWIDVLCKLHVNPNNATAIKRFVDLITIPTGFNSTFMPPGAGWILTKYWDKFSSSQRSAILSKLKTNANPISNSHGTENHFLNYRVGAFLFGQLWPNESGWAGRTGAQMRDKAKSDLLRFFRSIYGKGYSEYLSHNYMGVHFYAIHALYNCSSDQQLKDAANAVLLAHYSEIAANFFDGSLIGAFSRDADGQQRGDPQRNVRINTAIRATNWLHWAELMNTGSTTTAVFTGPGAAGYGGETRHWVTTEALSDWKMPALLTALAQGSGILPYTLTGAYPEFGENDIGNPAHVTRYNYREKLFSAGSGNHVHSIKPVAAKTGGLSQRFSHSYLFKSDRDVNEITVHHPYWRTNTNQNKWGSRASSPFQQNAQHLGTIISLFDIPDTDPFEGVTNSVWENYRNERFGSLIKQAWIRYPSHIDSGKVETDGWIFLNSGDVFFAIRPGTAYSVINDEYTDMTVIRTAEAGRNVVIMDAGTSEEFVSFEDFYQTVLEAPLDIDLETLSVTYQGVHGDTLSATWTPFSTTVPTTGPMYLNAFPVTSVNGEQRPSRDPDFVDASSRVKSPVINIEDRVLTVSLPQGKMEVDWSGQTPNVSGAEPVIDGGTSVTPAISLSVSPSAVLEDGDQSLVFTFTRTGSTSASLNVNYTVSGTATLGTDYTGIPSSGTIKTVTIPAGSFTTTVLATPVGDSSVENNETVILTLSAGNGYEIQTPNPVTGTITNDDQAPVPAISLSVSPSSVLENGAENLVFTFSRNGVIDNNLNVNYTVSGTAVLGTDYTGIPISGATKTVTIPSGSSTATVTVAPVPDSTVEANETVVLTLASGSGYTIVTTGPVTGTILNDDSTSPITATLPAFSPSSVNPSLFQGEEYMYGIPLYHLAELANSVIMEGDNKGFIDKKVWRAPEFNVPGNARVLENHVAFAFFYTVNRPWNIYRGNPVLKNRLEAVLEYLISPANLTIGTGNVDGTTQTIARLGSDKEAGQPNNNELAGSSFGVKHLGETLRLLEISRLAGGPTINETLRQQVISATRSIIKTCLGYLNFKVAATRFSNQYTGFWGGTLAYLSVHNDPEIRQLLVARIEKLADKDNPEIVTWQGAPLKVLLSSPAGYHYENSGPDWKYVFTTNYPNIKDVLHYERGTSFMDPIVEIEQPWVDWLSYNAVREPNGSLFILNRAIQTRVVNFGGFDFEEFALSESTTLARAFARTQTEYEDLVQRNRQALINGWNSPKTLSSYNPGTFVDKGPDRFQWRPTAAQRSAAISSLPYLAQTGFVHQRSDSKITVTFVRRPSYYAIFNTGTLRASNYQRYGLGLAWGPQMGTVLHTQSSSVAPWGTSREGTTSKPPAPFEANPFTPTIKINGVTQTRQDGARDLPNGQSGTTTFEYNLFDGGQKVVTFNSNKIDVNITLTGTFLEQFGIILKENENLTVSSGVVRLVRGSNKFEITFPTNVTVTQRNAGGWPPPGYKVIGLSLKSSNSLSYSIAYSSV